MRHQSRYAWLGAAALALGAAGPVAADITGAGATFPYPIYAKWAEAYRKDTGIGMNYQSIGSGGGIAQIKARTVDFGASDMPLKPDDLAQAGLMQFPAIIGGIVPVVNLEGVAPGRLHLTGPVLADIYLGKIKSWNDKAIVDLNPGVKLGAEPITVVVGEATVLDTAAAGGGGDASVVPNRLARRLKSPGPTTPSALKSPVDQVWPV